MVDMDVVIFGGGAAGLWLLDELTRRGSQAILLESNSLCAGQTIASQGIIHGGLKYTLQGLLTGSATSIREMPEVWRDCLSGRREPDLSGVERRADCCFLWRTESWSSRLGMLGAQWGLRVSPQTVTDEGCPAILHGCPGTVALLPEQVISPKSFADVFSKRHAKCLLKIDPQDVMFDCSQRATVKSLRLRTHDGDRELQLQPKWVVFAAGSGNAALRGAVGLSGEVMQRRPLHMVLLRGASLPSFQGHCVDGAKTRVTITSDRDSGGRTIWQVGGQIAEEGVAYDEVRLLRMTCEELSCVLPSLDLSDVELTTYRVNRAEGCVPGGKRPETVQIRHEGNCLTAWPTKLALVPQLTSDLCELMASHGGISGTTSKDSLAEISKWNWPAPEVALPPWETATRWWTIGELLTGESSKASQIPSTRAA